MKVVIVGGGFAGIQTALDLANKPGFEVRLISDKSYFEYHAALYRSATGRSPFEVAIPLAEIFEDISNVEVVKDKIVSLDSKNRTITGQSESVYHYDALVLALGNITAYYNIEGLQKYSYGVKDIQDALELKSHIHEAVLKGEIGEKHYVIIGAGATGVEVAGELRAYANRIRQHHGLPNFDFQIDLIEGAPRVLPLMPEQFSKKVEKQLATLGVTVHTNTKVLAEDYNSLKLPTGEIQSHTVVWTAGVANNPFFSLYPEVFKTDKKGKVIVNDYSEAAPNIYVLGDCANTLYSGMAQIALHDAHFVAKVLLAKSANKTAPTYVPKPVSYAIPVGPHWSAVMVGGTQTFGFLGWVLRRLIDLKLYLYFLPLRKSLLTWRYGFIYDGICKTCRT